MQESDNDQSRLPNGTQAAEFGPTSAPTRQPVMPISSHQAEDEIIEKAINIAEAMGLGRTKKARRRVYTIVRNPNFPRLFLTGGPIAVRRRDLMAWLDGMARNHTFSGKPSGSNHRPDTEDR